MTSESQTESLQSSTGQSPVPNIALPKGGGAIRGIGETFSSNSMTGTGTAAIPISVSAPRSGFGPHLSLTYDSGSGNSAFGFGWNFDLPSIYLRTDKGLPRYTGEDIYVLDGSDDLMAVPVEFERDGYTIQLFRPRVEGLFARIERWTRILDGDVHWRSFTKDNILTIFGPDAELRVSDPKNPRHVFKWLIAASYDGRGNAIRYEYAPEDRRGIPAEDACRGIEPANRYPKRILYGNRNPSCDFSDDCSQDWMFEVVLDYGDEGFVSSVEADDEETTRLSDHKPDWAVRRDPFLNCRSGFEIRTYRLCRRILLFHRFEQELGTPRCLVRSTDFQFHEKPTGSFLAGAIQSGYMRNADGSYLRRSLPQVQFSYSQSPLEEDNPGPFEYREAESANLPTGIGDGHQWLDLDGEGISGVLFEQGTGWYYKRNLGRGHFGSVELLGSKPARGTGGRRQFFDVGGRGQIDLVDFTPGQAGFYERKPSESHSTGLENGWGRFRAFHHFPVTNTKDPNLRFTDLTGDGAADILITEDLVLRWHPSLKEEGFGSEVKIPAPLDEKEGPRVVFADPEQSVYLADMTGDGLSDIVRIRNGEVCYWPNLGYGRFGPKITMRGSPWFDTNDIFDNNRIRLADTDGSGTTDILYLSRNEIHVCLNESGNSLSEPKLLRGFPSPGAHDISVVDFLGRGTACLVWSSGFPADANRPLRYVDLMHGQKPHLLTGIVNNLGAEIRIEYTSSTEFYLADKAAGHPWLTPLPFPVHVVKRVETFDHIGSTHLISENSYHHGYYDGVEREFRGFGRIDRTDSEGFSDAVQMLPAGINEDPSWTVPPILTRTWYHTGVFLGADRVSRHLAHEYYKEPAEHAQILLDDTILPAGLDAEEAREACRALKGTQLRSEVYSLDKSEASGRPYMVVERNVTLRLVQPRGSNRHAVFYIHAREAVNASFERTLYSVAGKGRTDPRVSQALTLDVDEFGNVLRAATISYGRRFPAASPHLSPSDHARQAQTVTTVTESRFSNAVNEPHAYRVPVAIESRNFEFFGFDAREGSSRDGDRRLASFERVRAACLQAADGHHELPFEDFHGAGATGPGVYRRLLQHTRTRYRRDSLAGLLPLGELESLALPGESYSLALTAALRHEVYGERLSADDAERERAGYVDPDGDGNWWIPTGRVFYSAKPEDNPAEELRNARAHFFLPRRYVDAFGNASEIGYDPHDLTPVETLDPAGNVTRAELDYRTMQVRRLIDSNGNISEAAFDALGMLAATALIGKQGELSGDSLEGFVADLPRAVVLRHIRHPLENPHAVLGKTTSRMLYDVFGFERTRGDAHPQSGATYTLVRENHVAQVSADTETRIQHAFTWSDGFGRVVQKKTQAEPGVLTDHHETSPRWIGTGWTIFNNKGKPVRQYEPFFTATHEFEFAAAKGVTSTLLYDPMERGAATLNPNHTFQKTVIDPWSITVWDGNDNVLSDPARDETAGPLLRSMPASDYLPTWYEQRIQGALGKQQQDCSRKTAVHAATPGVTFVDAQGQKFIAIEHNRFIRDGQIFDEHYVTRNELDVQGNIRTVTDTLGRLVAAYDYDLAARKIHQSSSDSGDRWILSDVDGKPVFGADGLRQQMRYEYDVLRRNTALHVRYGDGTQHLAERNEFGETQPDAERRNLRGKLFRQFDETGVLELSLYDFKGNLLRSSRRMLADYRGAIDWDANPGLEAEIFQNETTYDALNRPVTTTVPDKSAIRLTYNESSLLKALEVNLKGSQDATQFVADIRYNARSQREWIAYGNGSHTVTTYDPLTFRIARIVTARGHDSKCLQDLTYASDPAGNVTSIADAAQQDVYFRNQVVSASGSYTYDAVYRLIESTGREHAGSLEREEPENTDFPRIHLPLPGDGHAMRSYRERYRYDPVGNILEMLHHAGIEGSWRRRYEYAASNNRVMGTSVGQQDERYDYDANGNMLQMRHLPSMTWDFRNQLASTRRQVVNEGQSETTYYTYDSGGRRARKITVGPAGKRRAERIYVGGFEIYREYESDGATVHLERSTLHVVDGQRRVALVETRAALASESEETTIRYQFDNHLGSACLELDDVAAVISYEEYYPFGSTSFQAGRSIAEVSLKRYRFTGKERDEETGFYYHGVRYCAPWLGRWTSADPKGLAAGINVYAYVRNNPLRYSDPTGTDCDPSVSCCVDTPDPSAVDPTAPTPREEQLQQSLPESERNLPPDSPADSGDVSSSEDGSQDTAQDASAGQTSGAPYVLVASGTNGIWFVVRSAYTPVSPTGVPLTGPLNLYTGPAARALAQAAPGYMIKDTAYYPIADVAETALRARYPGMTMLPVDEYNAIWGTASWEAVRDATLSGNGVQTHNDLATLASDSIQAQYELPPLRGFGTLMGGLNVAGGALTIYSATSDDMPTWMKPYAITSGTLQTGGGITYIVGAWGADGTLMAAGASVAETGGLMAIPLGFWGLSNMAAQGFTSMVEKGSHEQYDRMKEDYPDMTPAEYQQAQDAAAPFLGDEIDLLAGQPSY